MADTASLPTKPLSGEAIDIQWDLDKEWFLVGIGQDQIAARVPDEYYVSTLAADPIALVQEDGTIVLAYLSAGFDSDEDDSLITVTITSEGVVLGIVTSGPLGDAADIAFEILTGE